MNAQFITDEITSVTLPELARALSAGYRKVMASDFTSAEAMAAAFAQLCLECGNGKKAHRYNFGNEKLGSDWDGLYTEFQCDEIFDARTATIAKIKGPCSVSTWRSGPLKRVVLFPGHPWSRFVAFLSADGGAARYVEFLSCRDRYRKAWSAMYHGDAAAFSHELRLAGYYTADESTYTAGLVSIAKRSLPLCASVLADERRDFTDDEASNIVAIGTATLAETIWNGDRHVESGPEPFPLGAA